MNTRYYYLAAIIYLLASYFSLGHNHPDEYYQVLQFAAYKLNLAPLSHMTWEFKEEIRSGLMAGIVVAIYDVVRLAMTFNPFTVATTSLNPQLPNPFIIAFITRAFAALISLGATIFFIRVFLPKIETEEYRRWFILLSLFCWFAVYNSVRYSSENLSGKFFLLAFALLVLQFRRVYLQYILTGMCLGIAFTLRFQAGILIAGTVLWLLLIKRESLKLIILMSLTTVVTIFVANVLVDYWFYGHWVFTAWNYLAQNLFLGRVNSFDQEGWYFYLLVAALIPFGGFYVLAVFSEGIYRPKSLITWTVVPFVVFHILIGHKELRFLVPLIGFMPLLVINMLETINDKFNYTLGMKWHKAIKFMWGFNLFALILVCIVPSATQIPLCERVYSLYQKPGVFYYMTEGGNELDFYKRKNLNLIAIDKVSQVSCEKNKNCLVALTCEQVVNNNGYKGRVIFSDCPPWIFKLDFNGWLERTALYNVYELNNIENLHK